MDEAQNEVSAEAKVAEAPKEKVKLTIRGVLGDLDNGLDRKAIGKKYGLNPANVKRLFEDPKLKGAKVKPAPMFELEDDAPEIVARVFKPRVVKPKAEGEAIKAQVATDTAAPAATSAPAPAAQDASTVNKGTW